MSDFGAVLIFSKKGGKQGSDDKSLILQEVNKTIENGDYSSHIKGKIYKELYDWEDNSFCLKFTEYYDDDDREEIWEFAEEEDLEEAQELIDTISPHLPEFNITSEFTSW